MAEEETPKESLLDKLMKGWNNLVVTSKSARRVCRSCGYEFTGSYYINKCPKCGSTNTEIISVQTTGFGFILKLLMFLGMIIAFTMGLVFSFLGIAQNFIAQIFPDFPTFQYIPYIIFFGLAFYAAYKFAKTSIVKGFIYCIILLVVVIFGSAFLIEAPKTIFPLLGLNQTIPGLENVDLICFLSKIWTEGPNTFQACSNPTDTGPPPVIKEGSYYSFNFKWGSEDTNFEKDFPMPLRKDSDTVYKYMFPVTIENPSKKKSVKEFYFSEETGLYNTSDMLIQKLYPTLCEESKKCEIAPEDVYLINFNSKTDIPYKINTLRIKINTSSSYTSYGNNTFVFVKTREYEKIAPTYKPYTSEGPIDITVYFAPVKYNFEYMSDMKEIRVYINLKNKGGGTARINKLSITRVGSQLLEAPATCEGPGGSYILTQADEKNEYIEFSFSRTLASYPQTYFCDYKVTTEKIDSPFETVTFLVSLDYKYEKIFEKEVKVTVQK